VGDSEGRQIWCVYFVFLHENRTMKSVETVLRQEGKTGPVWWELVPGEGEACKGVEEEKSWKYYIHMYVKEKK
jgi:hypothetical protein